MIPRLRLVVLLTRPAVIMLLTLFAGVGLAQAGRPEAKALLARVLVTVIGFLLFSVACNDLADEKIDRVNLPGLRPLTAGAVTRREFTIIGATGGAVAVAASATLSRGALLVTAAGLAVSAGYSLRPVRLADRGAVASLVLPACYVAVPYLIGIFAVRASLRGDDVLLLAGMYLGFIGRILLKDFRDLRGDALFGKRTFLVRHGRRWTCEFSAGCWLAGTVVMVAAVRPPGLPLGAAEAAGLAAALTLLRALARDRGPRRDEALIAAIAIIGRGMILLLLAHLSITAAGWPTSRYDLVLGILSVLTASQAASMARHGPVNRRTIRPGNRARLAEAVAAAAAHDAAAACGGRPG